MGGDDIDEIAAEEDGRLEPFDLREFGCDHRPQMVGRLECLNGMEIVGGGAADEELLHGRSPVRLLPTERSRCSLSSTDSTAVWERLRHEGFALFVAGPTLMKPPPRARSANFAAGEWKAAEGIGV
jgi:hypothetical protein